MDNTQINYILDKNMQRFDEYIERADNKANFILTLSGVLIVASMFQSKEIISGVNNGVLKNLIFLDIFIINVSLIFSIVQALLVIIPRISKGSYSSLLFFDDVRILKNNEFYNKLRDEHNEFLVKDMSKQVIELANICSKKMSRVRNAFYGLGAALVCIFILSIITMINH